jgi:short-subunit dehydrogenase
MSGSSRTPGHVVITGAAGAIGSALARAMRAAWPDAELALVDRDEPIGVAAEVGGTAYRADLANLDALPALIERIEQNGRGWIDGLVNCAGVMHVRGVTAWRWEDARELVTIDLLAPLRLQDLVVRGMVERGNGLLVNVASMAGRVPLKGCAYYGAAKAGLAMASEIARADLRRSGVKVVTVYPGPVKSALEAGARADYGGGGWFGGFAPTGDPGVLATKIMRAIDEDRARVIYPSLYGVGWIAPNLSRRIALKFGPAPVDQASDFESVTNRRSPAMPATLS